MLNWWIDSLKRDSYPRYISFVTRSNRIRVEVEQRFLNMRNCHSHTKELLGQRLARGVIQIGIVKLPAPILRIQWIEPAYSRTGSLTDDTMRHLCIPS